MDNSVPTVVIRSPSLSLSYTYAIKNSAWHSTVITYKVLLKMTFKEKLKMDNMVISRQIMGYDLRFYIKHIFLITFLFATIPLIVVHPAKEFSLSYIIIWGHKI